MKRPNILISLLFLMGCTSQPISNPTVERIPTLQSQIFQRDEYIKQLEDQTRVLSESLEDLQGDIDNLILEIDTLSQWAASLQPTLTPIPTVTPTITSNKEPKSTQKTDTSYLVISVIDGDTIIVSTGEHVRLIGIDTPDSGECGELEASQYLSDRILGKYVDLISDPLTDDKDQYGRLLRYVEYDGIDMNLELVKAGYADSFVYHDLTGYPYSREETYHSSQGALISCNITTIIPDEDDPTSTPTNPCSGKVFPNCAAMKDAGCAPAIQGQDDWYRPARDGDGDGIACE